MFKQVLLAGAVAIAPLSVLAEVELNGWGTSVDVFSNSVCTDNTCSGTYQFAEDGGVNDKFASAELDNPFGNGRAIAKVDGAGFTPVLKAESNSYSGRGMNANAWGVQQYTYTGSVATTLTLALNLDGEVEGNGLISGAVAVIKGDEIPWTSDIATLVYEMVPYEDVLGYESVFIHASTASEVGTIIEFDVEPGDQFFVRADLKTRGRNGSSADAYNTFTMEFDDTTGLVAASDPEPVQEEDDLSEEAKRALIKTLWEVAYEDGKFTRWERRIVRKAAKLLGLPKGEARTIKLEVKAEAQAN